jgi:hypothetical protein
LIGNACHQVVADHVVGIHFAREVFDPAGNIHRIADEGVFQGGMTMNGKKVRVSTTRTIGTLSERRCPNAVARG